MDTKQQKYFKALVLGCFPDVSKFHESPDVLERLIYVDFKLQSIYHQNFGFKQVIPIDTFDSTGQCLVDLNELGRFLDTLVCQKGQPLESIYLKVLKTHLYTLTNYGSPSEIFEDEFTMNLTSYGGVKKRFSVYMKVRYYILLGIQDKSSSLDIWSEFLCNHLPQIYLTDVSTQNWIFSLFELIVKALDFNEITLEDLKKKVKFSQRPSVFIFFCCYLIINCPHNLSDRFAADFSIFLSKEIENKISEKKEFPKAIDPTISFEAYVHDLYSAFNLTGSWDKVIDNKLSGRFLLHATSRTYQSKTVTTNLIKYFVRCRAFKEPMSIFQTYLIDIKREMQHVGLADIDILAVIDIYSFMISSFNPFNSSVPFSEDILGGTDTNKLEVLVEAASELKAHLNYVSEVCGLSFNIQKDDEISFLFNKSTNPRSCTFSRLISDAWYALAKFEFYLSMYNPPNPSELFNVINSASSSYKNSLNFHGQKSLSKLSEYCLILALQNKIDVATKLVKYTLKKYPNSFKNWNLLVLLATAKESFDPDGHIKNLNDLKRDSSRDSEEIDAPITLVDSEAYVNNALQLAKVYIETSRDSGKEISMQEGYEILQLKMTQIAVMESIHGIEHASEYLNEVFSLFKLLFPQFHINSHEIAKPEFSRAASRSSIKSKISAATSAINRRPHPSKPKALSHDHDTVSHATKKMAHNYSSNSILSFESILQEVWLWCSKFYLRLGLMSEAEQCIVEAETVSNPNLHTFTMLGFLCIESRKSLAMREFEKSLEVYHSRKTGYPRSALGDTLLGFSKLFFSESDDDNLFISQKDRDYCLARLKNYLEDHSTCWPSGYNNSEVWWNLSLIYEKLGDKVLLEKSLKRCIQLEDYRPVRSFDSCIVNSMNLYR